jgi:putative phosphoesterase
LRVAVISDVHGNRLALEAVIKDIERHDVDSIVNLGDTISGPIDPVGTLDLLIETNFPTVRGNHDRWVLDPPEKQDPIDRFVAERLTGDHRSWLKRLPATMSIGDEIYLCHGTPTSDTEPWLDNWAAGRTVTLPTEADVAKLADGLDFPVILCGHTHVPHSGRLRDGRLIVNPGSVGLQFLYGSPDANYALVERNDGAWSVTQRRVPYDTREAALVVTQNGFPQWAPVLLNGWDGPEGLF